MNTLQDRFWLVIAGCIAAGAAAAFWGFTGAPGFEIMTSATMIFFVVENRRLRKRIVQLESKDVLQ